jgi:hypothetical protein
MSKVNARGRELLPGKYRREGNSVGNAHLVVCTSGEYWYIDRRDDRHQPPTKSQVDQLFNANYATRCVRFAEPPQCGGDRLLPRLPRRRVDQ